MDADSGEKGNKPGVSGSGILTLTFIELLSINITSFFLLDLYVPLKSRIKELSKGPLKDVVVGDFVGPH